MIGNRNEQMTVNSTCVGTVSQLSAYHSGFIATPSNITHCPPQSIDADLHPASTWQRSTAQPHSSISATVGSYGEEVKLKITVISQKYAHRQ